MQIDPPDGSSSNGSRQSALSTNREPMIPATHVLDRVQGRVLNPATALPVDGVDPRPWGLC